MDVTTTATRMVCNLNLVVDDARELGGFHIHPKKGQRLVRIAERAMALADEIEEEYDL